MCFFLLMSASTGVERCPIGRDIDTREPIAQRGHGDDVIGLGIPTRGWNWETYVALSYGEPHPERAVGLGQSNETGLWANAVHEPIARRTRTLKTPDLEDGRR